MAKKKNNKSDEPKGEKKAVTDEVTANSSNNISDSNISEEKISDHSTKKDLHTHAKYEQAHGTCCGNPKTRFRYTFWIIILILIGAVAEHFIKKSENPNLPLDGQQSAVNEDEKIHNQQLDELSQKIEKLHEEVAYLSSLKQMLISAESNSEQEIMQKKKWQAWIHLAKKIQNNEKIQEEFEIFRKAFEKDKEILEIVENFIKETRGTSADSEKEEGVIDISKRYLNKIIKINKVDSWKIREISGYILLSLKKYTIN